ncbi:MAG: hypothetical protein AAFY99_06210 [Pseudomonadota bacterium]
MKRAVFSLAISAVLVAPSFAQDTQTQGGEILSAFYGLDDSRRIRVATLRTCSGNTGPDGMPVIFSLEVDDSTLDADDFKVTTQGGEVGVVNCVTLRPADELGEKRTALLIGQYGSADDQPASVEIVGDLMSLEGDVNFKGATANVIAFEDGPTLILAEELPANYWDLGGEGDCPRDGLKNIVRAVWVGGITKPGGDEIDAKEMAMYRVTVRSEDGTTQTVTPMAVGDLGDNDNNHDLCLDVTGMPLSVYFPAGALTDPNEDINPETEIAVIPAE